MAYNFVAKEPTLTAITSGEFFAKRLSSISNADAYLDGQRFIKEVETVVTPWLILKDTDWYQQGIEKVICRYHKCLNYSGDNAEKWWYSNTINLLKPGGNFTYGQV
jgi:hypothetical protein